jgi:hypothetical protein
MSRKRCSVSALYASSASARFSIGKRDQIGNAFRAAAIA